VVTINGALGLKVLEASNGIIYVIDKLLVPDNDKSIVKVLESKGKFTTLITALVVAGLKNHLDTGTSNIFPYKISCLWFLMDYFANVAGPFTLFAPTDDAFKALPAGVLDSLLNKPKELQKVLLSHVVPATLYSRGLSSGQLHLARGGDVAVTVNESKLLTKFIIFLWFWILLRKGPYLRNFFNEVRYFSLLSWSKNFKRRRN
jgi:transforming growth factor-beta-induced protein